MRQELTFRSWKKAGCGRPVSGWALEPCEGDCVSVCGGVQAALEEGQFGHLPWQGAPSSFFQVKLGKKGLTK